ncbi:Putative Ephrin-B3, partial [Caligus rogercresseyi]
KEGVVPCDIRPTPLPFMRSIISLRRNHTNTDNILDVNHGNEPGNTIRSTSSVQNYSPSSTTQNEKMMMKKKNMPHTQPASRIVALCDKPHELIYFTISLRSSRPPLAAWSSARKRLYFISTSSPSDLKSKNGGRCSSHNMKIAFK